jgi:Protein of unknown function (DUF3048).
MRNKHGLGAIVLVAALTLAGCVSGAEEQADELATEEDQGVVDSDADIEIDADLWPLTGSPRGGGDASLPVLAAKIDNHPLARPQVGLDSADIVFEELVEGGITRVCKKF